MEIILDLIRDSYNSYVTDKLRIKIFDDEVTIILNDREVTVDKSEFVHIAKFIASDSKD